MKYFLTPGIIFALLWIAVLFLFSARLSFVLNDLNIETIYLVLGSAISLCMGWLAASFFTGNLISLKVDIARLRDFVEGRKFKFRFNLAKIIFVFGFSAELALERGLPLLSLFGVGRFVVYADFGIPVVHGFLNALYLAICVCAASRYIMRDQFSFWKIFPLLLYPILTFNRQMIVSILVQLFILYCITKGFNVKRVLRASLFIIGFIALFGYLGDLRTGRDNFLSLAQPSFDVPGFIPSGFLWAYIYITTPLNNLNANIDISPMFYPNQTIINLFPSVVRNFIFPSSDVPEWHLVAASFNVSSMFQPVLSDFGFAGTLIYFFILGKISSVFLYLSRISLSSFFIYVVILHCLMLSFFFNLLTHIVILFQIIVLAYVFRSGTLR